ncbi:MAG TPA: C40 family peptidase [Burkholderiales bacterium]|nr:C40 family peptidase [Burkholderiales bacterium]
MIALDALVPEVMAHAARDRPRECCGLAVVRRGRLRYWPCRNIAGESEFALHPEDQAAAEDAGEVVAICHSHVYLPPEPSEADRVMCGRTRLPWLIVSWPTGAHRVIEPDGYLPPLVGRPFVHGVLDCYALVRDYYAGIGIGLRDYPREDDWWLKGANLYLDHFAAEGFVEIDQYDMRPHDALLMQIASPVPNHAGVIDRDGHLLHHCHGRLSSRDVYGGYWRKVTTHVLRHRSLL